MHSPLAAGSGSVTATGGQVRWNGEVTATAGVTITYALRLADSLAGGTVVTNSVQIETAEGEALTRTAAVIVGGERLHFPLLRR